MLDTPTPTDPFGAALRTYLADTLHLAVALEAWGGGAGLPIFIGKRYRFYQITLARRPCLFMAVSAEAAVGPAEISKHVALVAATYEGVVVYAAGAMSATTRSRLIAQGVAFIVPGNQLYIPQLAMDLRDHFRAPVKKRGEHLSPAAQLVLFHHILFGDDTPLTPTLLAEPLEFAAMSIGRAFDQLAQANLARVEWRGRQKVLHYAADRRTLIDMSRTLLRTPVRGVHGVRFKGERPAMLRAGETALADLTDLAPPERPTYAILATGWQEFFRKHDIENVNDIEAADALIETWRYDPHTLSRGETVDPLSLHAQFRDHADERVAQAAVDVLERVQW